jgi:hypothetical protein
LRCLAGIVWIAVGSFGGYRLLSASAADEAAEEPAPESKSDKQRRESMLLAMRRQLQPVSVAKVVDGKRQMPEELRSEPVFRYSDPPRGFVDATLWCWGATGRPVALQKVEAALTRDKKPFWQFCLTSLDDHPIDVNFGNGHRFVSKKPGLELKNLLPAPMPDDKPAGRLRQMKEQIARFAATIHVDGKEDLKQEMRLLPREVYRYADEGGGLQDGAIFGLTTNGTNPDVLIVIELRAEGNAGAWQYGVVKMTDSDVHVRLDDAEVWSSRFAVPFETWFYFDTPRQD